MYAPVLTGALVCRKIYIIFKNGVWGVAPRRVAGTPVPVFTPFPGERGQGDRDNKSEVNFKNRLFLQTDCCNRQLQQSVNHIILYFAFKVNTRSALSSIRLILISPLFTAFSTALKDFSRLSGMRIISAPAFTAITAAVSDV